MSERSRSRSMRSMEDRRDRSRSRSVHSISSHGSDNSGQTSTIYVKNFPISWGYLKIRHYIRENNKTLASAIKFVTVLKDGNRKGECLIKFANRSSAQSALDLFNGASCDDKVLVTGFSNQTIDVKQGTRNRSRGPAQQQQQWRGRKRSESPKRNRKQDNFNNSYTESTPSDSMETYGLNHSYLNGLGIKLPLLNKIFIANLDPRVDEEKLQEIFGHAGTINNVLFLKKVDGKSMAKIEYDHPVEAVQAISMLHNQELYGKKLVVHMDNSPGAFRKKIPEGLNAFGPGLGIKGEPMKAVRTVVELQMIKAMLLQELQKNKPAENQNSLNQLQVDTMVNPAMNVQNTLTPFNLMGNMFPLKTNALLELQNILNPTAQTLQMQQSLIQPDLATTLATLQSQNLAQNVANVPVFTQNSVSDWTAQSQTQNQVQTQAPSQLQSQNVYGNRHQQTDRFDYNNEKSQYSTDTRRSYDKNHRQGEYKQDKDDDVITEKPNMSTDMVVFSNLPSSVSLQALSSKMREVGEVKFAETTGMGRAIVRFFNIQDAERCIKLFNHSKVDGQTIEVMFF